MGRIVPIIAIGSLPVFTYIPRSSRSTDKANIDNFVLFVNMPNWTVLGNYLATTAEGSHTFNFAAVDFDDDSMLVLVIDISVTATLTLQMRINNNTDMSYFIDGRAITGGAETLLDQNTQTEMEIASSTLLNAVNQNASIFIKIGLTQSGTSQRPMAWVEAAGGGGDNEQVVGRLAVATADISRIDIITSTSTWQSGGRMTLYKVARKD